jgi:hypothetical protein
MAKKNQKNISIDISIENLKDLSYIFTVLKQQLMDGVESGEFSVLTSNFTFCMEYHQKREKRVETDSKEQITHIVQSNI